MSLRRELALRFRANAIFENSPFERAVNTPWIVARDTRTDTWYLSGGKFWYSAKDPRGPWQGGANPPSDLLKIVPKDAIGVLWERVVLLL